MSDVIQGPVTTVFDGNTFQMRVTHRGSANRDRYKDTETVCMQPELQIPRDPRASILRTLLERRVLGKNVSVTVRTRDQYGRVVAADVREVRSEGGV